MRNRYVLLATCVGLAAAALVFLLEPQRGVRAQAGPAIHVAADLQAPRTPIPRELLGQFVPNPRTRIFEPDNRQAAAVQVATYLRGVYGAFYADLYDWRDPLGLADPLRTGGPQEISNQIGTLDYLRVAAANGAAVSINVNTRGVRDVFTQPLAENLTWVMTDTEVLASWAADWVHYTGYTIRKFDAANPPDPDSADFLEAHSAAILDAIRWENRDGSRRGDELPQPGERLPAVVYWEIGNEPNFPLSGFRLLPDEFARRYVAITEAMIARDILIHGERTIRVGPSLTANYPPARSSLPDYLAALDREGAVVDFVGYHPYTTLFGAWEFGPEGVTSSGTPGEAAAFTAGQVEEVRSVLSGLSGFHETLFYSTTLAAPAGAEVMATEWNPSSWEAAYLHPWKAESMAHALGVLETVFSFARVGVDAAVYFAEPALGDRTQQPMYETFAFLERALGDQLLAVSDGGAPEAAPHRAYITRRDGPPRPGEIVLWGLNWGEAPVAFEFSVENLDGVYGVGQRCELAAPSLLHGGWGSPGAPPLEAPLEVRCVDNPYRQPPGGGWEGRLDLRVEVPANSWVAVVIQRVEPGIRDMEPGLFDPVACLREPELLTPPSPAV